MKYSEGKVAMKALENAGWQHISTTMCGERANGRFGMLWIKGNRQFWLNKNTYKILPCADDCGEYDANHIIDA